MAAENSSRIHHQHRGTVNGRIRSHRMNEGDVVCAGAEIWKEIADPLSALAVLLELPARFDDSSLVAMAAATEGFDFDCFAIHSVHGGLIVEGVDLTWTAIHVQEDDVLRFGFEVRLLWSQWISERRLAISSDGLAGQKTIVIQQCCHRDTSKTGAGLPEHFTSSSSAEVLSHGRDSSAGLCEEGRDQLCRIMIDRPGKVMRE